MYFNDIADSSLFWIVFFAPIILCCRLSRILHICAALGYSLLSQPIFTLWFPIKGPVSLSGNRRLKNFMMAMAMLIYDQDVLQF